MRGAAPKCVVILADRISCVGVVNVGVMLKVWFENILEGYGQQRTGELR